MHEWKNLQFPESLESSVSKKLSDSVPLGSWLYGAGPLPEYLSDELPEPDRSFTRGGHSHTRNESIRDRGQSEVKGSTSFSR